MHTPLCFRPVAAVAVALLFLADAPAGAQRHATAAAHAAARATAPARTVVRADDGHGLVVWSRHPRGAARGAILLLHGRTWSSLPNFDLQVPGLHESLMDALAARGWAAYALDQRGYGATPRDSSGWLTPSRAARDAHEVLDWISAHEKLAAKPVLFGYSQGSMTSMLAALRDPSRMSAIVLYGFPLDVNAMPRGAAPKPVMQRRRTTAEGAGEDFITPESTPAGVKDAYVRAAVAADPVRMDWRDESEFLALTPDSLRVPTLLIAGERDPYANAAHLQGFIARMNGVDRALVVLARADHAAHLERQREFVNALLGFLERAGK